MKTEPIEPMGKITPENLPFLKEKIQRILEDGGEKRDVNEWLFFYDKQNRYQGYCLRTEWELAVQE